MAPKIKGLARIKKLEKSLAEARRALKKEVVAKALPLVQQLSRCFGVTCPEVRAYTQIAYVRGRYRRDTEPERIELVVRHFATDVVLHEFAHHLQCLKYAAKEGAMADGIESHGAEFFQALLQVASHYYGDPELYDWDWTEVACPETVNRFQKASAIPPLADMLKDKHPRLFKDYARACKKAMTPCRLCNPHTQHRAAGR
jgi:hypothetical protein